MAIVAEIFAKVGAVSRSLASGLEGSGGGAELTDLDGVSTEHRQSPQHRLAAVCEDGGEKGRGSSQGTSGGRGWVGEWGAGVLGEV